MKDQIIGPSSSRMSRRCVLVLGVVSWLAAPRSPLLAQGPDAGPKSKRAKPDAIGVDPGTFVEQGNEFYLDVRHGVIRDLPTADGVDLSGYDLEVTFDGGSGRLAQLFYKNERGKNVYSKAETIVRINRAVLILTPPRPPNTLAPMA